MIKKYLITFLVVAAIATTITHCMPGGNKLKRVWFFTYRQDMSSSANINREANRFMTAYALNPSHFFCLQPDGTYTMYFKEFEYGKWEKKENYILFKNSNGREKVLQIEVMGNNELTAIIPGINGGAYAIHFEGSPIGVDKNEDNPFYFTNNFWRIKATHKETDKEIADRLRNYFRYWEKYFTWGLTIEKHSLDVRSLQGPLKMYGNGFGLIPYEEESAEWLSHFYDEEDSRKAYDKINYLFDHENIAWANTDNKFKMFISAFQQLQEKIK